MQFEINLPKCMHLARDAAKNIKEGLNKFILKYIRNKYNKNINIVLRNDEFKFEC